jgi:hypothetical protein
MLLLKIRSADPCGRRREAGFHGVRRGTERVPLGFFTGYGRLDSRTLGGPCPLAQARPHDGRRRDRDERAGQGLGVYGALAGRQLTKSSQTVSPEAVTPVCFSESGRTADISVPSAFAVWRAVGETGLPGPKSARLRAFVGLESQASEHKCRQCKPMSVADLY